ncbi:transglutaminase domain-containing protein [Luteolibacter algae]|uniref:Transglutaminase domain-containing protein n=1 Tax=Luteolibacter algae TaxID=454151 RepID=A0ABW5DAH2_9BACT
MSNNQKWFASTLGTKISVRHRTTFHYASPVTHSVNTLHLEPRTFPCQKTMLALIRVLPATRMRCFTDLFQNITHHFELPQAHSKLEIESRIKVHNLPLEVPEISREMTVADYQDTAVRETVWAYLQESHWVSNYSEVWRQAVDLTTGVTSVFEQAGIIMEWIHSEFTYATGVTSASTHLEEAFRLRCGVCQDFTHVMLGLCRAVGIPARYASGYLYNGPRDSLVGAQASHAWAEVYLPGAGWIGFDPTNNNLADERYVKIAVGRDYEDVAPVRGSYSGTGQCRMEVSVEVSKAD